MPKTTGRHLRRWQLLVAAMASAALLPACSSAGHGATAQASQQANAPTGPTATNAQIAQVAARAMNPGIDVATLPPEVRTVFASAAHRLTPAQQAIWQRCIASPICDTGQGTKTVALVDDLQQPWYSISAGEFYAQAIQSGQVRKIIHTSTNADLGQFLSNFRQAIAQRVNFIVSEFGALGAQAGPVLAQAKAAGIPVINAATLLPPAEGQLLPVELRAAPCDMWKNGAPVLTAHLKQEGITHPTYAVFSGPPGNAYAASWQPCGENDLDNLGWKKIYTGYNIWTPQGQTEAASALLASGIKPDVILADIAPSQFLQAYVSAHQKLPLIMVAGSVDVNALKAYLQAKQAGVNPDVWTSSSVNLMLRVALVTGLEIADGMKPSSNPIVYPLQAISFADVVKTADLNVDSNSIAGSLLSPAEQNQALKY
jgi:ABC-type sugar transport system substrate-binding protein